MPLTGRGQTESKKGEKIRKKESRGDVIWVGEKEMERFMLYIDLGVKGLPRVARIRRFVRNPHPQRCDRRSIDSR